MAPPPPLKLPAKIGLALGVVLFVCAVGGFLVYWLVVRPAHANTNGGSGVVKFGTIEISDLTSRSAKNSFAPGDTLQLKYVPTQFGFSGRSVWSFSSDGGTTFATTISSPTLANVVSWIIPTTLFTQQAVFKVSDADNADDFITSTPPFLTIAPVFQLVSGPATVHTDDQVTAQTNVTCVIQTDTGLANLTPQDWIVTLSQDPTFQTGNTDATLISATVDTTQQQITVVWQAGQAKTNLYYQVSTTELIQQGYPYQLQAASPHTLTVLTPGSCSSTSGPDFQWCSLTMTDASGNTQNFLPGSTVTLTLTYKNTYPGTTTFAYTVDGGTSQPWTVTPGPTTHSSLTFTATLPNTPQSPHFIVTATSDGISIQNPDPGYNIVATFAIANVPPTTVFNVNPSCNNITFYFTTLTLQPPTYTSTFHVGWANTDGTQLFTKAPISLTFDAAAGTATLKWCLDWTDLGQTKPVGQLPRRFVVLDTVTGLQQFVALKFNVANYYPNFLPIFNVDNDYGASLTLSGVNQASGMSSPAFTLTADSTNALPWGLWPQDASHPDQFVISSSPQGDSNTVYWWGPPAYTTKFPSFGPLASQIPYPSVVTSTSFAVPASVVPYGLVNTSGQQAGTLTFVIPDNVDPQYSIPLNVVPYDTASNLYALASTFPDKKTDYYTWPGQNLPF